MADPTPSGVIIQWLVAKSKSTLQEGMAALYQRIIDHTPAGEIADNSLEFKFDADNRLNMKRACGLPLQHGAREPYLTG